MILYFTKSAKREILSFIKVFFLTLILESISITIRYIFVERGCRLVNDIRRVSGKTGLKSQKKRLIDIGYLAPCFVIS